MFADVTVNNFGDILASLSLALFQGGKEYLISMFKHKIVSQKHLCVLRFRFEHTGGYVPYFLYLSFVLRNIRKQCWWCVLFLLEIHSGFEINKYYFVRLEKQTWEMKKCSLFWDL